MRKIDIKLISVFILWIILSVFTFFVYFVNNEALKWIDIPAHFMAGVLVVLIISRSEKYFDFKKMFILSFLVFMFWEFFEISASTFLKNEFIINIFQETVKNRIQDILMDILGFMVFVLVKK